ncbi:MAG: hypothetical protein ACUVS7_00005, partial [Bryobacteraceae bacterium]
AKGRVAEAITAYIGGDGASPRGFRKAYRKRAEIRPRLAMRRALDDLSHLPPQKAFHVFLLTNDMRRHLHDTFEAAPRHGFDFVVPFYDRRILHSVLSLAPPLEPFLGHRLYHETIRHLSPEFFHVPWQTYPGHLPCPVADGQPPPGFFVDQWQLSRRLRRQNGEFFRRKVTRSLFSGRVPGRVVRIPALAANILAHKLRVTDSGHWLRTTDQLTELLFPDSFLSDPEETCP